MTRKQLKQIIKEEILKLNEFSSNENLYDMFFKNLSFREKMRKQHTKELRKRIEKEGYDTSKISNEDIFLIGLELAK